LPVGSLLRMILKITELLWRLTHLEARTITTLWSDKPIGGKIHGTS